MSASNKQNGRKTGLFSSFTGIICGCSANEGKEDGLEFSGHKSRALSTGTSSYAINTPNVTQNQKCYSIIINCVWQKAHRDESDDWLIFYPIIGIPYKKRPVCKSLHELTFTALKIALMYILICVALQAIIVIQTSALAALEKTPNEKGVAFLEPRLDLSDEKLVQRVSLRFNKIGRISGFGIGIQGIMSTNAFSLGAVAKRRNTWIQNNLLSPTSQNSAIASENEFHQGGYYIYHDSVIDKSIITIGERTEPFPLTWKAKDHIIMEFFATSPAKLKITVVNNQNFEQNVESISLNLPNLLSTVDNPLYQPVLNMTSNKGTLRNNYPDVEVSDPKDLHFAFILDQITDTVEILGDPELNNIRGKVPPTLQNIQLHDISQKYYMETSCCSKLMLFENHSIDCIVLSGLNSSDKYRFAYFKPCLPFPDEKIYIKRVAFQIDDIGSGEFFLGLTREAYAINNIFMDTSNPECDWHGRKFLFKSSGRPSENSLTYGSMGSAHNSSFATGSILILEYNPFLDQITMINDQNHHSVLTGLYRDFSLSEFEDKSNRYCFCFGGAKDFRVSLLNDYYDDIDDPKSI